MTIQKVEDRDEINKLVKAGKYLLAAEAIKRFAKVDRDSRDEAVDREVSSILDQQAMTDGTPILQMAVLDFQAPIITTNFDTILEYTLRSVDLDTAYPVFTYEDQREITQRLDPTEDHSRYIFKLHGSIRKGGLILDEGDYANIYFHERWPVALALLRHILATKMVVFIGFSLSDPEIMPILREATRYAGSYQHIAFLKDTDISRIEQDTLRSYYSVEPILYQQHSELPLFVMEMRNFNPREELTLKLQSKRKDLLTTLTDIILNHNLDDDASIIVFGSCVKYGDLASKSADLDILVIYPRATDLKKITTPDVIPLVGRRLDITVVTRFAFEDLLAQGDAFASSVLVTGCPISDPYGFFGILARGFRPDYDVLDVRGNALERCRMRWLRLCALQVSGDHADLRRACLQWTLSFMQLVIIRRKTPTNLLGTSLLGNARYVIHEFVHILDSRDELFFLDLLKVAKGLDTMRADDWPAIRDVTGKLAAAIGEADDYDDLELITPGAALQKLPIERLIQVSKGVAAILNKVQSNDMQESLPGQMEEDLDRHFRQAQLGPGINSYDLLFFFELIKVIEAPYQDNNAMTAAVEKFRNEWK